MKYSNYIILSILLLIAVIFKDSIHVSTNLLSLFASKNSIEKLNIADKLGYSKEMFIAVKGFDNTSKIKIKEIKQKLLKNKKIISITSNIVPSQEIKSFYKKNYPLMAEFNNEVQTKELIYSKLEKLYKAQFTNIFYSSINKDDPLKLFNLNSINIPNIQNNGDLIALGSYGYLMKITTTVSPSDMAKASQLYDEVKYILNEYDNVVAFAPFFYTVENSKKIKDDVKWIIILSTLFLLIIYYLLIKNLRLLSHTIVTLASSMLFSILISTFVYQEFNILSLAFGMSITAVSIDYLLHYYFHNFYQNSEKIDKSVMYGYLTTTVAFGIFTFIPIAIIAQISFFAVISLSFAYIIFTFIFPYLDIPQYVENETSLKSNNKIPAYIFFISSIFLLIYSYFNITLDTNIRHLDYQNTKLMALEKLFKQSNDIKMYPVIVHAKTKEELIKNLHIINKEQVSSFSLASFIQDKRTCLKKKEILENYNFKNLNNIINIQANAIGFRDSYFKNSYSFIDKNINCEIYDLKIFQSYGLSIYNDTKNYYTIALIKDTKNIDNFDFATNINIKQIFTKVANEMYKNLLIYSIIVISIIFILLFLSVKKRYIYALNYILFPISITLAGLTTIGSVNIMHIFSLIILIAIGIDYGIYMSNSKKLSNTILAIKYSLLSTFSAFGVLIFSSITALNSIGIVISFGIASIFILMKGMK